jgi:hypothetical protein
VKVQPVAAATAILALVTPGALLASPARSVREAVALTEGEKTQMLQLARATARQSGSPNPPTTVRMVAPWPLRR